MQAEPSFLASGQPNSCQGCSWWPSGCRQQTRLWLSTLLLPFLCLLSCRCPWVRPALVPSSCAWAPAAPCQPRGIHCCHQPAHQPGQESLFCFFLYPVIPFQPPGLQRGFGICGGLWKSSILALSFFLSACLPALLSNCLNTSVRLFFFWWIWQLWSEKGNLGKYFKSQLWKSVCIQEMIN